MASTTVNLSVSTGEQKTITFNTAGTYVADNLEFVISGDSSNQIFNILTSTGTAAKTSSPYKYSMWNGSCSEITALSDGLTITYKVPVAGSEKYGTCLQVNSLGYHPVVSVLNSPIGTRYPAGSVILLQYDSTKSGTVYNNSASSSNISGVWRVLNDQSVEWETF